MKVPTTALSEKCVFLWGYLVGELQVVQQLGNHVRVQALHCGVSLERGFLDSTLHHGVLDDGYDESVSFCQLAVQLFLLRKRKTTVSE